MNKNKDILEVDEQEWRQLKVVKIDEQELRRMKANEGIVEQGEGNWRLMNKNKDMKELEVDEHE